DSRPSPPPEPVMDLFSRREFLDRSAILAAATAALGPTARAQDAPRTATAVAAARGASDKLRVAVVGVRGRGMSHVSGFLGKNNCEITTVCDCDEAVIGNAMRSIEKVQGRAPTYQKDVRRVVENRDIDIVSIATPNHWHALMAIWAMQNGKDVYCEKPATHNVREGAIMTAAARKYGRICQVGTQSRSNPGMRQAIEAVQSGRIGTVDLAIGLCYKNRPSIGKVPGPQEPPATMDYDLWCGPAPLEAPRRKTGNGTVHYDWHWVWNYGNGDLGNQGVHEMDKARWGLRKALPNSVCSVGGRFGYVDDGQTANTQVCLFDYGESKMVFEVRGLKSPNYKGAGVGNIWVGSEGMVVCPNYAGGVVYNRDGQEVAKYNGGSDQHHFDNFVKAVRSRRVQDLNCDIAEGHVSAALCHLANISYRLGAEGPLAGDVVGFAGSPTAADALARMKAHLQEHKVDPATAVGRAGPKLTFDPATERFTGDRAAEANAMLFREYRRGFEVRESV
ncbi:MAG TPA: Gfo/Idh/MocA family oxidoreductase, partial [Urbifossiella sp.]|nr:Gfo/Idh/MocA family oxidoreductase [Urbifossiella sp.]